MEATACRRCRSASWSTSTRRWSGAARWSPRRWSSCCNETNWQDLDYLVVDLPPGTGDIQLTLAQQVPVTGAVIVTTPQDIALLDARKGLKMFEKVGVPILGIVENMSIHICSNCGHEEHIFGDGGGGRMCKDYGIEFLGALPLDIRIREQTDAGKPTRGGRPRRAHRRDLPGHRPPRGGEDRGAGQGHDLEVPQHRDPEHVKHTSPAVEAFQQGMHRIPPPPFAGRDLLTATA